MKRMFVLLFALLAFAACGDHYEGGGRRDKVPTRAQTEGPNVEPGDGSTSQGGSAGTSALGEAGMAATEGPFPFAGSASGSSGG